MEKPRYSYNRAENSNYKITWYVDSFLLDTVTDMPMDKPRYSYNRAENSNSKIT